MYMRHTNSGFSLVIVLLLLFAFIVSYPLIFRNVNEGRRLSDACGQWIRLQVAADSGFNRVVEDNPAIGATTNATYSYPIGPLATFSIYIEGTVLDADEARVAVTSWADRSDGIFPSGFSSAMFGATYTQNIASFTEVGNGTPTSYLSWTKVY